MTDDELMKQFSNCSLEAFKKIYNRNKLKISNYIVKAFQIEPEAAEDISQNCFIKVFESKFVYKHQNQFSSWLYTIAKNFSLNEINRNKRIVLTEEDEFLKNDIANEHEVTEHDEIIKLIKREIMNLPANYREILTLRYDDNMSLKEIAEITGKNLNTVKSLLKRGLQNIKDNLSNIDFDNL